MTPSTRINRLGTALACALVAAAIGAPLAQASTVVTEHSTSQNRVDSRNAYGPPDPWQIRYLHGVEGGNVFGPPDPWEYRYLHGVEGGNVYGPPDPWQYPYLHPTNSTGYRFITENSASQNRLPSAIVSTRDVSVSAQRFDWLSALIGAVAAVGCGVIFVLLTRRVVRSGRDRGMVPSVPTR